jgi:hypothetical protein
MREGNIIYCSANNRRPIDSGRRKIGLFALLIVRGPPARGVLAKCAKELLICACASLLGTSRDALCLSILVTSNYLYV